MFLFLLTGCRLFSADTPLAYPEASLSTAWNLSAELGEVVVGESASETITLTNLGGLDLGVAEIALEQGEHFALSYDLAEAYCALGGAGVTVLDEGFLLHAGCALPLRVTLQPADSGALFDLLSVSTFTEDVPSPSFFADFRDPVEQLMISGIGLSGALDIDPLSVDFGQVTPGDSTTARISLKNIGDGPSEVIAPELSCAEEFFIDTSLLSTNLESGESTLLEVIFSPDNDSGSQCLLLLSTPQGDRQVFLQGNRTSGVNTPPTVSIYTPSVGHVHDGLSDLELQLSISDAEQAADTLYCSIKSAWQTGERLADCSPPDATGNVTVTIPTAELSHGVDTLEVRVVDDNDAIAIATTTISWMYLSESDDDGDGFSDADDCDDNDQTTYPEAAEVWDGADNDCDGIIDEDTEGVDDDGDTVTEADGDCDDTDETIYPGAPEEADQKDNDCDGIVDEGTHAVDDDGDGYSPDLGDCDDNNAEIFPDAMELCDGFDNDCDYLVDFADDDGCVMLDAPPEIVGCLHEDAITSVGERVVLDLAVLDEDVSPEIFWEASDGSLTNPSGSTTAWLAPATISGESKVFTVTGTATDSAGQSTWCFQEITVLAAPLEDTAVDRLIRRADGCGGSEGAAALLLLPMLGLRRRKQA
jgi:hypothetical protein